MTNGFSEASKDEAYWAAQAAKRQKLQWINRVVNAHSEGDIGTTGRRVALSLVEHFLWDRIDEHGAPLMGRHRDLAEQAGYSHQTFYVARKQLLAAGLIVTDRAQWYALVEGGHGD